MSKPRYDWWGYAKAMIRRYPDRCLPNEKEAVESAIETTKMVDTGEERLKIIDMVFLKRSHTLEGAAMAAHISNRTAQRWHADFIREVGRNFRCSSLIAEPIRCHPILEPRQKNNGEIFNFSVAQKQVITLLADNGMRVYRVARRLGICENSVHGCIARIKLKTGLDCRDFWELLQLNKMVRKEEDTDVH